MADVGQTVILEHACDAWLELAGVLAASGPAPCEIGDPEAWWPVRGDSPDAVAGCEGCPARAACLAYAVAADERRGIWGATTPAERQQLARLNAA
jgi:WhiB family redox-sensing transcriptional regulator